MSSKPCGMPAGTITTSPAAMGRRSPPLNTPPLLGPTELDGLLLATGHYRNGVLLTPITGDAMAQVLTTGELPDVARPFTPKRFSPARTEQPA